MRRAPLLTFPQAVEASRQLLQEHGAEGLSMRNLANATMVSLPTVYSAIGSRARLVAALLDVALTELAGELAAFSPEDLASDGAKTLQLVHSWILDRLWFYDLLNESGERGIVDAIGRLDPIVTSRLNVLPTAGQDTSWEVSFASLLYLCRLVHHLVNAGRVDGPNAGALTLRLATCLARPDIALTTVG